MNIRSQPWWVYALIAGVIVLLLAVVLFVRRRVSKYTLADLQAGGSPPESTIYSNIVQCQVTYNTANISATDVTRPGFLATFEECVRSNVVFYMDTKCKWIDLDPTAQGVNGATQAEVEAYNQYVTDTRAIETAYADMITKADAVATSTAPAAAVVEAARKADFTGATRRYLANVCPGYYKTSTGDLGDTYKLWTVVPKTSSQPSAYSFWPGSSGSITKASIDAWARGAADYTVDNTNFTFTVGTPYLASGSIYTSVSNVSPLLNWELLRDNGPGTYVPQA